MSRANKGLRWQRTADAMRSFVSLYGSSAPRRAIFCTYDFDVERFEAVLAPELTRRGRQFRTLVTADAGALQAHLQQSGKRRFGRFQVAPVKCRPGGVFHPKLVLLAAGRHHLVGVGSANLTAGGLGGNLEMMLFADNRTEHGRRLVGGAANFLDRLLRHESILMPLSAREFIEMALAGIPRDPTAFSDSLKTPLLGQMKAAHYDHARHNDARELTILSPWHSAAASTDGVDPAVLRKLKDSLGTSRVNVYTEGRNGRGPGLGTHARVHIRTEKISAPAKDETPATDTDALLERRPMRVHAKAYLVESSRGGGTLFFGSANCTQPALTRSVSHRGNVEILVASKLGTTEVASVRNDLADLFSLAEKSFLVTSAPPPAQTSGVVLAGHLLKGSAKTRLRLETPTLSAGVVRIAGEPKGRLIRVRIRRGVGFVDNPADIQALFKSSEPDRTSESWGGVLWERVGTSFAPFPVSVPLIAGESGAPDDVLLDFVWEELGVWPATAQGEASDDDEAQDLAADDDKDLEALTEAKHEGQLDRLAVAVSILRKRIAAADAGSSYSEARLRIFRGQIAKLDLPAHVRGVLLDYLRPGKRARRVIR